MFRLGLIPALLVLSACTERPEVAALLGAPPAGNDFPTLLPVQQLEALDVEIDPEETRRNEELLARGRALQRRANAR